MESLWLFGGQHGGDQQWTKQGAVCHKPGETQQWPWWRVSGLRMFFEGTANMICWWIRCGMGEKEELSLIQGLGMWNYNVFLNISQCLSEGSVLWAFLKNVVKGWVSRSHVLNPFQHSYFSMSVDFFYIIRRNFWHLHYIQCRSPFSLVLLNQISKHLEPLSCSRHADSRASDKHIHIERCSLNENCFCLLCSVPSESISYISPRFLLINLQNPAIIFSVLAFSWVWLCVWYDRSGVQPKHNGRCWLWDMRRINVPLQCKYLRWGHYELFNQGITTFRWSRSGRFCSTRGVSGVWRFRIPRVNCSSQILQIQFSRCRFQPLSMPQFSHKGLEKEYELSSPQGRPLLLTFAYVCLVDIKKRFFCTNYKNSYHVLSQKFTAQSL